MPPCLAVIDGGLSFRTCKNYTRKGRHTCASHKNFLFQLEPDRCPLKHLHIRKEGVRKNIEEWLRLDLLCVDEASVQGFKGSLRWAYFWMLCARYGRIRPEWNPALYKKIVAQLFCWWKGVSAGPIELRNADILSVICVKGNCSAFHDGLMMFPTGLLEGLSENLVFWLFYDAARLHPEWFLEWFSGGFADGDKKTYQVLGRSRCHPMTHILEGERMAKWIQAQKAKFYGRRLIFTEELVAVTHHPSRCIEWTMDWEAKMEFENRWGPQVMSRVPLRMLGEDF